MRRILIAGATSAIAQEVAKHFAAENASFLLAGLYDPQLAAVAEDLVARGAKQVETLELDFLDLAACPGVIEKAVKCLGGLDVLFIAHGTLPDQAACEHDPARTLREFSLNVLSTIALLIPAANHFEAQGSGRLAVITSMAGVRGRRSNYVYGAAKASVSTFLEGLRCRMAAAGVQVTDIRPGFVDTPMTAHLPKNPLYASPEVVGERAYRAIVAGTDVVYVPWFWRWIALVIQLIPRPIFKKLNF